MVYSTIDVFTAVVSTRGLVTHRVKLVVGATHTPPADILAAVVTLQSSHTEREGSCKNQVTNLLGLL